MPRSTTPRQVLGDGKNREKHPEMDLLLYYHPHSFYSQKVVMALFEKGLPFSTRFVNIINGKQFTTEFLTLNPRGEVPVLVDQKTRVIVDSAHIINYLEDNFSNGFHRLRPDDPELRARCEYLNQEIHGLKLESLAFGSAVHSTRDLHINPRPPYNIEKERANIRNLVENRKKILKHEAKKFPFASGSILDKLRDYESDYPSIVNRDQYEGLILQFERVLDECEAELASHEDQSWFLVSPSLSLADISLSVLLYRLWLLGFDSRMWNRTRPYISSYFNRMRKVDSFKKAISLSDNSSNPQLGSLFNSNTLWALGAVGVALGVFYLFSKCNRRSIGEFLGLCDREIGSGGGGRVSQMGHVGGGAFGGRVYGAAVSPACFD